MTTPNIDVDFGAMPELRSYATTSTSSGVFLTEGSIYTKLPEGVSMITATIQEGGGTVYLAKATSYKERYVTRAAEAGVPVSLSNVAVAKGESRYLNIAADKEGVDVGVTIITWPLTT